jgi:hypothetical protein
MGASTSASASAKSVAGLPGPVACQRLTDGPWLAWAVAGVMDRRRGDGGRGRVPVQEGEGEGEGGGEGEGEGGQAFTA